MLMADEKRNSNNMMQYAGLASQWMFMLLAAVGAGWYLDKKTGWKFPLFIIILPLAALAVSLWRLVKVLNKPKK